MTNSDVVPLRLAALDDEDLAVVSAHLQDAEVSLDQMAYLPRQARFAFVAARFDWPLAAKGRFMRGETGVHFERVLHVARSGFTGIDPDRALRLLAIAFLPGNAPSGMVLLTFLGGAQIRLSVECIEAEMRDIGPRWTVEARPGPDDAPAAPPKGGPTPLPSR